MQEAIAPGSVRYIKLGGAGTWEKKCIVDGIIRLGFDTERHFDLCAEGRWNDLREAYIAQGVNSATNATNQVRRFFEDAGTTLWITFVGEHLYWGQLDGSMAEKHPDGGGVFRRILGGWKSHDLKGKLLLKSNLSGAVTRLALYRGTSCRVEAADYLVRRINGLTNEWAQKALDAEQRFCEACGPLLQQLTPRDFETLMDLIFSASGWRRQSAVGGTMANIDFSVRLPFTNELAYVQVKSKATSATLGEVIAQLDNGGEFERLFFAYHSGDVKTDDERVVLLGPKELPRYVVEAGLFDWLVERTGAHVN